MSQLQMSNIRLNGKLLTEKEAAAFRQRSQLRNGGRLIAMLRDRKAPGCNTEDTFQSVYGTLNNQFDGNERELQAHIKACAEHGFRPGDNDIYLPTIARFKGDPRAHVKTRAEARQYAEERGARQFVGGNQVVSGREPEKDWLPESTPMAEDLVAEVAKDMVKANPDLARKKPGELRDAVLAKHAGGKFTQKALKKR